MPRIFPYPVHVDRLDNGLTVVVVPMSSDGLVAFWSIVRTGSRDEYEAGHSGFAHFFEHMMFRGTEAVPEQEYNRIVTEMGADANAFTSDDLTAYHLSIAAEDLETVMRIESDRFRNLSYAEQAFRTEAGAVHGEYRKNRTNPFFALYERLMETAFREHTYGHTTMGYERDIRRMPEMYDYSREFFRRYYRPDNVVLLVVGDVDPAETLRTARRHYGDWEAGYEAPRVRPEPEQTEQRRIDVDYDGRTLPLVWVAYKLPAFDPADGPWVGARLLGELAFGETSRIHRRLVLDEQLVEFVAADAGMNRDPGLFDVYARVKDPARVDEVLDEIDRTIERYRTEAPDPERLAALKSRLRYGFLMGLDTPDAVASSLARLIAVTGDARAIDTLYATIARTEPEDVLAAARTVLRPERRTVAVLRGDE